MNNIKALLGCFCGSRQLGQTIVTSLEIFGQTLLHYNELF